MNKSNTYLSVLMAGLLTAAAAHAQYAPGGGSSDLPPKAGEASTQTQGMPNARTTNTTAAEAPVSTKDSIRQGASGRNAATATTSVPGRAGEASTMVQGKPNANPEDPNLSKSRAELKSEATTRRSQKEADRSAKTMGNTRDSASKSTTGTTPEAPPSGGEGATTK